MLKIERAGDVLADTPAKVAQSILLFCKGQGLLTSVVMPGVDRARAFSTSSGGSNGEPRRLSRGELNVKDNAFTRCTYEYSRTEHGYECGSLCSFLPLLYISPVFKQECPWRSTTSPTFVAYPSPSTTSCHQFRQRNKYIRRSAPADGFVDNRRFKHISTQIRECISLTFK